MNIADNISVPFLKKIKLDVAIGTRTRKKFPRAFF